MNSSFIGFVNNAALLLALGLLYDVLQFGHKGEKFVFQQISTGLILGSIGIAIMLNPWDFGQGVMFDSRSVLLCISGFFLGTIPLLLAVLITSVFRLSIGGAGAWTGVAVIVTSGGIGLAWRHLHRDRKKDPTTGELYLLGIVVHITMLAWMLSLPWQVALGVLSKITLPVMLIHPLATALLGKLMVNRGKRKRSEEALRASDQDLKESQRIAHVGSWSLDVSSNQVVWSEELYKMYGFDPALPPPPYTEHQKLFTPESWSRLSAALNNTRDKGIPYELELETVREDGSCGWMWVHGEAVLDTRGVTIGLRGAAQDITDRKRLEEELLRTQKIESVGLLAGGIAHDFNNILTTIIGNVSMARMQVASDDEIFEMLSEAEMASLRAQTLTQQLLTFAKGGAPVKETASINDILKGSASFMLRGSKSNCEFSISKDLWPAEIDVGQISQVINNIVINANQSMPGGGIIQIAAENLIVADRYDLPVKPGKFIKISIKDQGVGILEKHLLNIFDPYFTTKHEGRGLGLATTYTIIKKHEGHITVESQLGVGTTFHIYLPASDKAVPEKEKVMLIKGRGRILVMDDEASLRKMVGRMLKNLGYESELAKDGAETILMVKEAKEAGKPYDAVIMDLTIPGGMGGKEAINKLLEIDPEVKAIVSSGYSDDPVLANFQEFGFKGMMPKPFESLSLSKVLQEVLMGIVDL